MHVKLRPAVGARDEKLLFNWRNLEEIYSLGSSKKPVSLNEHKSWFKKAVIESSLCRIFIIQANGEDCGQLRYDFLSPKTWEISIYLLKNYKDLGIGTLAMQSAIKLVPKETELIATVLLGNQRSKGFFEKNGFLCFYEDKVCYRLRKSV